MKNYLKEGYKNNILIKEDDINQLNATKDFLSQLESDFKSFQKIYHEKEDQHNAWTSKISKSKRRTIFTPEVLTKQSAMTLIDAKWGSGKTYFVENVLKNMETEEVSSYFEHGILVDGWKLSLSNDVVADLFSEIIYSLLQLNSDGETKLAIESIVRWIYDMSKPSWSKKGIIKKATKIEITRTDYELALEKIRGKIKPTLIFIDNLERVGRDAWDIIKSASKLLVIPNIVVVLPINLSKMHKVYDEDEESNILKTETIIEKYLDIKYFEFNQDYIGLLKEYNFDDVVSSKINEWLKISKNGNVLSVREAKHRIDGIKLYKKNDMYEILGLFNGRIWDNDLHFNEWVNDEISIINRNFTLVKKEVDDLLKKSLSLIGSINIGNEEVFGNFYKLILKNGKINDNFLQISRVIDENIKSINNWEANANEYTINVKRKIEKFNSEITELKSTIKKLDDEKNVRTANNRNISKQLDILGEKLTYDEKKDAKVNKEIKKLKLTHETNYDEILKINGNLRNCNNQISEISGKLVELKSINLNVFSKIDQIIENLNTIRRKVKELNESCKELNSKEITKKFFKFYEKNPQSSITSFQQEMLNNSRNKEYIEQNLSNKENTRQQNNVNYKSSSNGVIYA